MSGADNAVSSRRVALSVCGLLLVASLVWLYCSCLPYARGIVPFTFLSKRTPLKPPSDSNSGALNAHNMTIWFVESSNETCLNGRQACSIESASFRNPKSRVVLLTTGRLSADCDYYRALCSLSNFRDFRLNLTEAFSETPLESWYRSRNWTRGPYGIEDLSDGIRLAVLWKRGGTYLDLDVIVLKDLSALRNSVMFEVTGQLTNSVLFFDKGHPFVGEALRRCAQEYDAVRWGSCGPSLLGRIYYSWKNWPGRGQVRFRERDTFFAVGYNAWTLFFEPSKTSSVFEATAWSYGVHLWNKLSHGVRVVTGSGTALDVLSRFNCPRVYEVMMSRKFF
ncbi:lactosylceramide 4-alpha-galactosyltransferase-like [Amblyomma americanum]